MSYASLARLIRVSYVCGLHRGSDSAGNICPHNALRCHQFMSFAGDDVGNSWVVWRVHSIRCSYSPLRPSSSVFTRSLLKSTGWPSWRVIFGPVFIDQRRLQSTSRPIHTHTHPILPSLRFSRLLHNVAVDFGRRINLSPSTKYHPRRQRYQWLVVGPTTWTE